MIYFDNAATTFPKPDIVLQNTFEFAKLHCANPGRSAHKIGVLSSKVVYECREKIGAMFNISDINKIAFTKNCSEALNIGLFSTIKENDHIITSVLEHNSIIRPLEYLKKEKNIDITYLEPNENMIITKDIVEKNIKNNTKLIALCHANNIVGTFNDIEDIGQLAKEKNILFLVDVAQSAGKKNIDVQKMNIDILCSPGHKSLFSLSGTGFIYANEKLHLKPILYGGTGSFSDDTNQPNIMPDMLETGTLNVVGIKSMLEGINWINSIGIDAISKKESELTHYMISQLSKINNIIIYTPKNEELAGIISINIKDMDSSFVTAILDSKYDIAVRGGVHCNPKGHLFIGTLQSGFVRASISYFNTKNEVDIFVNAINDIQKMKYQDNVYSYKKIR
jgi:cysteine desulfurase family protein